MKAAIFKMQWFSFRYNFFLPVTERETMKYNIAKLLRLIRFV